MPYLLQIIAGLLFGINLAIFTSSCESEVSTQEEETTIEDVADYQGTGSVTQGYAETMITNLFIMGGRIAGQGKITDGNGVSWTVPSEVDFYNDNVPFLPDLSNPYGTEYISKEAALAALNPDDVIEIDSDGELITAYIFADNYFELYVNGMAIGKDAVPFTQFNSHLVQIRVNKPFTIAMKLVDWEENLGIGTESGQGSNHHPGDGGVVAVFEDVNQNIIATTNENWKAQTFYTAPIKDLSCPTENGSLRLTTDCDMSASDEGTNLYALHWELAEDWMMENFDDSEWPSATTYSNETIGVDNKRSYTDFTSIFDNPLADAQFIWSQNVILDNLVIVRYTVSE